MRNYWLKILLGALGIFAIGMIGVSLVRGGIAKVHSVVEGDGPITIPLGLIPFVLRGSGSATSTTSPCTGNLPPASARWSWR